MTRQTEDQFESLESAHSFVTLLAETVTEAKNQLDGDLVRESADSRRRDALRIAHYNLAKLELHVNSTRRILNDLRTLRRLLFEERRRIHPEKANNEPNAHPVAA